MQKLNDELLKNHVDHGVENEYIPAIDGAEYYFALVNYNGRKVLCLLDESDQWRPTSQVEMMKLAS